MATAGNLSYPHLFSSWSIRHTPLENRVVFAPTCPTWVSNPYDAAFTEQAVAYYEERARHGLGLIITGGNLISRDALYSPFLFPGLWNDEQTAGLAAVVDAVHRHGTKIAVQLLHPGQRTYHTLKTDPAYDFDAQWHTVGPSQLPTAELPGSPVPKQLEEHEIEQIFADYESAARRAVAAGVDGVEFHMAHGYLPWQFLSPLYNHRTDQWGGSRENRLRFPVTAMQRIRSVIGDDTFLGYRINSTAFWEGDLEIGEVADVVAAFEEQVDLDYVSLSAGVHHSFIHTPMTYEAGWEREYTRAVKKVTEKPVLLVGRFTDPADAEDALASGDGDAILLARQMFADEQWTLKAKEGRSEDIRKCVAANFCWRTATRGQRVQCVYNPVVGRERQWSSLPRAGSSKRALVIGAGPAGLEYARVAAARGHSVVLYERDERPGGHILAHAALPSRERYGDIAVWLHDQATKNGAEVHLASEVTQNNIHDVIAREGAEHVVVATGSHQRRDGFQGQTGAAIPGWETSNCVSWEEVATGRAVPRGRVLVVDDQQDVVGPLVATMLARQGAEVRITTRWPMIAMETAPEVYLHWVLTDLYNADVDILVDHFPVAIRPGSVDLANVYRADAVRTADADWVVMATARQSVNDLYHHLHQHDVSVECLGDATAPRGTYEATFEGHRAARKL